MCADVKKKKYKCLSVFAISERSVLLQICRNRCARWEGAAWRLRWSDGFITPPNEKQWLNCGLRKGRLESYRRSRHLDTCAHRDMQMEEWQDGPGERCLWSSEVGQRALPASSLCPDLLLHGSQHSRVPWPAIVTTHYTNPWWNDRWE